MLYPQPSILFDASLSLCRKYVLVYYCFGVTLQKDKTLADGGTHYYLSLVSFIIRLEYNKRQYTVGCKFTIAGSVLLYMAPVLFLPLPSVLLDASFYLHPANNSSDAMILWSILCPRIRKWHRSKLCLCVMLKSVRLLCLMATRTVRNLTPHFPFSPSPSSPH